MEPFVALLRGINVGGKNALPMQELVRQLEALGAQDVKTYIQSGNAVFRLDKGNAESLAAQLGARIRQDSGFAPFVLVLTRAALAKAVANNPYAQAQTQPNSLHLGFLAALPRQANLQKMAELKAASEAFQLQRKVLYLHAPDGIGRSRLAARAESLLGVDMTLRNWRTVCALLELAQQ
jgi:uncharacterized protein (DUF1697 family)